MCEFTISSLVARVLGPAPGPHREQGACRSMVQGEREEKVKDREYCSRFGGDKALTHWIFLIVGPYVPLSSIGFNILQDN